MECPVATGWTNVHPAGEAEAMWVGHRYGLNCVPPKFIG